MTAVQPIQGQGEVILYQTDDGQSRIEVRLMNETVWLTQKQMADLFQKDVRTINEHIRNIFNEGELQPDSTIRNFRIVQIEGKRQIERDVAHYNLDVVISVGYRVKSLRGTQFRIWATQRLRDYLVKGFLLDDERFKRGKDGNYFDELLAHPRYSFLGKGILAQGARYLCHQHRLRPIRRRHAKLFRHGAKQNALVGAWADRRRNCPYPRRCQPSQYGVGIVSVRPNASAQSGRNCRQKLPECRGTRPT